jgi:23S rRNA (cytidine1920-2'-O)/16S rRNA (cytidine1409-2'-O)-methyltransferase
MKRLDTYLFEIGAVPSREKAKRLIMAGLVLVEGKRVDKPGFRVKGVEKVQLLEPPRYVSRGGYKLENALRRFSLNVKGAVVLDIGSSTGGFADCLLKHGAKRVYCVDVGRGQLHPSLRNEDRVIFYEKLDARALTDRHVPERVDLITVDVSFISVTRILDRVIPFLKEKGSLLVLVKPQFELSPKEVKKGIVKEVNSKRKALKKVIDYMIGMELRIRGVIKASPKGVKGNEEFFVLARFEGDNIDIEKSVEKALNEVAEGGE